jgi:hypothetical protein
MSRTLDSANPRKRAASLAVSRRYSSSTFAYPPVATNTERGAVDKLVALSDGLDNSWRENPERNHLWQREAELVRCGAVESPFSKPSSNFALQTAWCRC